MAKPIFLVIIPKSIIREQLAEINEALQIRFPDYHTLAVNGFEVTEVTFQAFYDKDLIETDFEAFKAEVLNAMK